MYVLGIDPSINKTGWALLYGDQLMAYGTWKGSPNIKDEWSGRLFDLVDQLRNFKILYHELFEQEELLIVIERPDSWTRDKNAGSLMKLCFAAGWYCCYFQVLYPNATVNTVAVSTWKGKTPKRQTQMMIKSMFGKKKINDHEADACGLCLWGESDHRFRRLTNG